MNALLNILKLFPYVLAGVSAVEQVAGAMPGAAKKQIILDSILTGAKVGEQVPVPQVAAVSTLVDAVVSALNASGVFTHRAPAAVATNGA
jgi:hypothetical protein